MKPIDFALERPADLDSAISAVEAHGDDGKILAGGQSLIPLLNYRLARPDYLVDLSRVTSLRGIAREPSGTLVGAMVTYAELMHSADIADAVPLLPLVLPSIANKAVRNRGTIGGSAAHADPAGEIPAVLSTLDAEMIIESASGSRIVGARDFFQGTFETALRSNEILTRIRIPSLAQGSGFATNEVSRRHGDFALVGAFSKVRVSRDGSIVEAAVAMSGVASTPQRLPELEKYLVGTRMDPAARSHAKELAWEVLHPSDDLHATAGYRRDVGSHLAVRTAHEAYQRALATNTI